MREIKKEVFYVGVIHPDRPLFDEFMNLPDGTSYNSYLIKGSEKTALIDTVDPDKLEEFSKNLYELGLTVDYIISNHAEQDHSGSIPKALEWYPNAKVVTNEKCKKILQDELQIHDDKFLIVNDRDTLSLGNKTLEFIFAPWVHWPETMFTYLKEDNILFTCDLFGSHIAFNDLFVQDTSLVLAEAKRYFAGIMLPFRQFIKKHLKTIASLQVDMIAPSHGPIYQNPSLILDAYREWVSPVTNNEVVIAYVSMHGSTKKMADYLAIKLREKLISVKLINVVTNIDELLISLVDAKTLLIGSPTFLCHAHPAAVNAAYLFNLIHPKTQYLGVFGSDEWGGKMVDAIKNVLTVCRPEFLGSVVVRGYPKGENFAEMDRFVQAIVDKHNV